MIVPDVDRERIRAAASSAHLVVEDIVEDTRGSAWTVALVVDGADDAAADLDTLAAFSRELDPLAQDWGPPERTVVLEVSSRGVDAPLTEVRHWRRARGRSVDVTYRPGADGPDRARVGAVDETAGTVRLVRRAGRAPVAETIRLADVDRAVVRVEFAPAPEDELAVLDPGQGSRTTAGARQEETPR